MAKYNSEYKLEVVKSVLEDGLSMREAAEKYNTNNWLNAIAQ